MIAPTTLHCEKKNGEIEKLKGMVSKGPRLLLSLSNGVGL